ncbi:MAG: T9SS type A sorting domain-containing protein [Ignavibacteriaceae bacterium]
MKLLRLFLINAIIITLSTLSLAQNYVGSSVCQGCHDNVNPNTGYNIWTEYMTSGHPYKLNEVTGGPPTFPPNTSPGVPDPPPGTSWNDYSWMIGGYGWKARFVLPDGKVFNTTQEAQYNLETMGWVPYEFGNVKIYNYSCFKCHTTGPDPSGSWNGNPADSLGTFSEPGIRCEGCHGPGSEHASNPSIHPPIQGEDLQINRCGDCHQRGGTTNNIPASGGYIKHHEQINEMRASKHGDGNSPDLTCASCHETHVPLRYPDSTPEEAIKVTCQTCHPNKEILLNGQPKNIDCVDCHMAPASKSAVGLVVGNGRRGDVKTHIMGINTNAVDYTGMFNAGGTEVLLDANGLAAVTLDFVCLRCHTTEDVSWASGYAIDIHTNGINDVETDYNIPAEYILAQNYPNPFNPTTKIDFALPEPSQVQISIYTITGELVDDILNEYMPAGSHKLSFVADGLPSGIYLYKMTAGKFSSTKKMTLLK